MAVPGACVLQRPARGRYAVPLHPIAAFWKISVGTTATAWRRRLGQHTRTAIQKHFESCYCNFVGCINPSIKTSGRGQPVYRCSWIIWLQLAHRGVAAGAALFLLPFCYVGLVCVSVDDSGHVPKAQVEGRKHAHRSGGRCLQTSLL